MSALLCLYMCQAKKSILLKQERQQEKEAVIVTLYHLIKNEKTLFFLLFVQLNSSLFMYRLFQSKLSLYRNLGFDLQTSNCGKKTPL